jgi:hypothetical protein
MFVFGVVGGAEWCVSLVGEWRVSGRREQPAVMFVSSLSGWGLAHPGPTVAFPLWDWRARIGQARHQIEPPRPLCRSATSLQL